VALSVLQAQPDANRALIDATRETAVQRERAHAAEAALAAAREASSRGASEEVLAAQRRATAAEADAAAAQDANAVLQFVAAAEVKRVRAAAAAEVAALRAELSRLREKASSGDKATHGSVALPGDGAAQELWALVQQQDEALRDLVAQVHALEAASKGATAAQQHSSAMDDATTDDEDGVPPPPPPPAGGSARRGGVASSLRRGGAAIPPLRSQWDPMPRP
jgi:hypothetical protein